MVQHYFNYLIQYLCYSQSTLLSNVGIVMEMMIVGTELTNHQNTARVTDEPVSAISSHAIMAIVYHEFIYVMETTTAWITVMKIVVINVVSILKPVNYQVNWKRYLKCTWCYQNKRVDWYLNCNLRFYLRTFKSL